MGLGPAHWKPSLRSTPKLTSQRRSCLNNTLFDNLMTFANGAGAKVVFGLNLAKRTHDHQ